MTVLLVPLAVAVLVGVVFLIAGLSCSFQEARELPHASADLCQELLTSLRDHPEQWSGISDNPYTQAKWGDFRYEVRHASGVTLWISNGWAFFKVRDPHELYIPLRWRLPMYWYYRKHKHRMQQSGPRDAAKPAVKVLDQFRQR